ncbi:MAG: helix-turn-helix transcriptional regulator [Roseivirga sp.]|nr:helix-turn-helix transcriptional regulator [Roseivirga sp.]
MIIEHKTIDLWAKPLLTWVTMETPMEQSVPLPSEACFAYIMEGDNHALSIKPEIKAEPGQVILSLCGNTVGRMLSAQEKGRVSTVVVHFHTEILRQAYQNSPPSFWKELEAPVVQFIVQTAASGLIKRYFESLVYLFEYREAVSEEILVLKLKELIALLMQTENSPQILQIMRSLFSERTFSFKEVVDAHICTPATIENLAMLTSHSLSSFKREFKRIYNDTPASYIMDKRAEKVAGLLAVSDESISHIGYDCGFTSPAHLSRVFKNKYGVTPSEYRLNLSGK